jgi:hypothetical protein
MLALIACCGGVSLRTLLIGTGVAALLVGVGGGLLAVVSLLRRSLSGIVGGLHAERASAQTVASQPRGLSAVGGSAQPREDRPTGL